MQKKNKLLFASSITLTIFLLELIGGILNNSLALVSDSFHVILDVLALFFSFFAIHVSENVTPTDDYSFGFHRLEIIVALVNGILLGGMAFYIILEAIERLLNPQTVRAVYVLIIAAIGIGVNIISIILLHKEEKDVNVKSAFFHVVGDTLASVLVIVGAIIIFFTGFYVIDTIMALCIAGILIFGTINVLKNSFIILMQRTPKGIDIEHITKLITDHKEICNLHDLHVWNLCSDVVILTAHVTLNYEMKEIEKIDELSSRISDQLENHGISHSTLQFETQDSKCKYLKGKELYCIHSDNHDNHSGHSH